MVNAFSVRAEVLSRQPTRRPDLSARSQETNHPCQFDGAWSPQGEAMLACYCAGGSSYSFAPWHSRAGKRSRPRQSPSVQDHAIEHCDLIPVPADLDRLRVVLVANLARTLTQAHVRS